MIPAASGDNSITFSPLQAGARFRPGRRSGNYLMRSPRGRSVAMFSVLRLLVLTVAIILAALPIALAQESPLHINREYRFAVIFPGEPMTREIQYTTRAGTSVPARQFFIENDAARYAVTVVQFADGRSEDRRAVEHAAEGLRRRGEILFQAYANYDPGMPGRQLNIRETNGRQLRASVYMYDRRLFITEASAAPGDLPAIQFEQSIMLLDEEGNDVDLEGIELVLAFIGDIFGRIFP
ncbi:MAG: hypothetical protein ACREC6_15505 [Hyphomicrobiaceae bacterium]